MTRMDRRSADPSRLGTVEDVNGSTIGVKLDDHTTSGLLFVRGEGYRVGQVGSFVRIPSGYVDLFGIVSQVGAGAAPGPPETAPMLGNRWLRVELVGEGRPGGDFQRGISQYPSIGDPVHVVTESDLRRVYAPGQDEAYVAIGKVASAESIPAYVNLNALLSRHSAVVGSTGAGKSNAVAMLLNALADPASFKAARIVLFDLHGEYGGAFGNAARVFRVGANTAKGEHELHVPFWGLTDDEFTSIAMGGAVGPPRLWAQESILAAKRASMPGGTPHGISDHDVTVDTPLPFSVFRLWHELYSFQCATHTVSENQNQSESTRAYQEAGSPAKKLLGDALKLQPPQFKPVDMASPNKVYRGQYSGLGRTHLDLLEARLRDPRLRFIFQPGPWAPTLDHKTSKDLDSLFNDWIGASKPITVFDLSAVPSTVLDDLVGAILRLLYDGIYWGRARPEGGRHRPLLLVLEEAHRYLGAGSDTAEVRQAGRAARAARRIAKEGRKYGASLMLVSQRPSEVDPTILSQCGTIASLRLTNEADRAQVSACASDNLKGLFGMLPILRTGEALVVGEAVNMPVRAVIQRAPEGRRPDSADPQAVVPRGKDGKRVREGGWTDAPKGEAYDSLIGAWRRQDPNWPGVPKPAAGVKPKPEKPA